MPSGWDNECEDWVPHDGVRFAVHEQDRDIYGVYKTKPEVLHAETNAIAKVAQSSESCKDAVMFCTHLPCIQCAKLIHQSGINTVYFKTDYNAAIGSGNNFLESSGIKTIKVDENNLPQTIV